MVPNLFHPPLKKLNQIQWYKADKNNLHGITKLIFSREYNPKNIFSSREHGLQNVNPIRETGSYPSVVSISVEHHKLNKNAAVHKL